MSLNSQYYTDTDENSEDGISDSGGQSSQSDLAVEERSSSNLSNATSNAPSLPTTDEEGREGGESRTSAEWDGEEEGEEEVQTVGYIERTGYMWLSGILDTSMAVIFLSVPTALEICEVKEGYPKNIRAKLTEAYTIIECSYWIQLIMGVAMIIEFFRRHDKGLLLLIRLHIWGIYALILCNAMFVIRLLLAFKPLFEMNEFECIQFLTSLVLLFRVATIWFWQRYKKEIREHREHFKEDPNCKHCRGQETVEVLGSNLDVVCPSRY